MMELIRKPIHYTQEGKRIFDQFYLDEDYNVPEVKEEQGLQVEWCWLQTVKERIRIPAS